MIPELERNEKKGANWAKALLNQDITLARGEETEGYSSSRIETAENEMARIYIEENGYGV